MGEMISFGHMSFITLPFIITFQPFELSRRMPAFVCDMNTDRAKSFLLIPLQFCLRVKRIIPVSSRANSRNLFKFSVDSSYVSELQKSPPNDRIL